MKTYYEIEYERGNGYGCHCCRNTSTHNDSFYSTENMIDFLGRLQSYKTPSYSEFICHEKIRYNGSDKKLNILKAWGENAGDHEIDFIREITPNEDDSRMVKDIDISNYEKEIEAVCKKYTDQYDKYIKKITGVEINKKVKSDIKTLKKLIKNYPEKAKEFLTSV